MQMISWSTIVLLTCFPASLSASPGSPSQMQLIERMEQPGGLVREKLRLPGFDPDEAVLAIAIHPGSGGNRKAPARSADNRRRPAWGMYMAGGYQTTGGAPIQEPGGALIPEVDG